MRVTSIQPDLSDNPPDNRLELILQRMDEAHGSDLILLPELWHCGYFSFDAYRAASQTLSGPVVVACQEKAKDLGAWLHMGSIVERDGDKLYNTSVLVGADGEIAATYRKIHLFGFQSRERDLLHCGTEVVAAETPWGTAGLSTCYDLRFPELYRRMLDRGATYFLVASAWPKARVDAWRLFTRARAHENLAYLFSCNCAGLDNGQAYAGRSLFVNPMGTVIAEGGAGSCTVSAEVDLTSVADARQRFSAVHDRVLR